MQSCNIQGNIVFFILAIIVGVTLTGCSKTDETATSIAVDAVTPTQESINLSEIADSISYIQLHGIEDPIGNIETLKFIDSLIVAFDSKGKQILLFGNDGAFKKKISSYGSGPAEYINCRQIDVDKDRHHILIFDSTKGSVLRFDLDNNYIGADSIGVADDFFYLGNGNYLIANYVEERDELAGIYHVTTSPFSSKKLRGCRDNVVIGMPFYFFDRDGSPSIMTRSYEDKVLQWRGDSLEVIADFAIEQNPSKAQMEEIRNNPMKCLEYLDRVYFFNYDKFLLVYFWYGREGRYLIYNKNNQTFDVVLDVFNDIDGINGMRKSISVNNSIVSIVDDDEDEDLAPKIQFIHLK